MVCNPTYERIPLPSKPYTSFQEFYPFYLGEHRHPVNRIMHILGTSISILMLLRLAAAYLHLFATTLHLGTLASGTTSWGMTEADILKWTVLSVVEGYAVAWIGHFVVEKNKPATFKYPLYSLMGDGVMLCEVLTLQRRLL